MDSTSSAINFPDECRAGPKRLALPQSPVHLMPDCWDGLVKRSTGLGALCATIVAEMKRLHLVNPRAPVKPMLVTFFKLIVSESTG